jgi:hypothetical protein
MPWLIFLLMVVLPGEVTILPDLSNLGSGATGLSIFEGVSMVGVNVTEKGSGYLCDPGISIEGPTMAMAGTEAAATGTAKMFNGQLIGVTITDPGTGYQASDFGGMGSNGYRRIRIWCIGRILC